MKPSEGLKDDDLGKLISSHRTGLFRYWWCFLLSGCFFVMLVIFWKAGQQRTERRSHVRDLRYLIGP